MRRPRPIEKGQHRAVARRDPRRARVDVGGIEQGGRIDRVERLGQAARQLRPAHRADMRIARETRAVEIAVETAQCGKGARVRGCLHSALHALREEAAEIGGLQARECRKRRQFAQMFLKECEKGGEIARVVRQRVARGALLVFELGAPAGDCRQKVAGSGETGCQFARASHPRRVASTVRPRKFSSSVPWPGWNFDVAREPKARMPGGMSRFNCRRSSAWLWTSVDAPP